MEKNDPEYRLVPWDSQKQEPILNNKKQKQRVVLPVLVAGILLGFALNDSHYKSEYEQALKENISLIELSQKKLKDLESKINNVGTTTNPNLLILGEDSQTNEIMKYQVKLTNYLEYINENGPEFYTSLDLEKMNAIKIQDPNE